MGEPGNSRGHRSNLSDHIAGQLGSSTLEDSCVGSSVGPPSYASVNMDLSLNTLTSLVPPMSPITHPQTVYTMPQPPPPPLPSTLQPMRLASDKNRRPATSPTTPTNNCVPNFLRPQRYLHSNRSLSLSGCVDQLMVRNSFRGGNNHIFNRRNAESGAATGYQSRSLENLVLNTAAIGQSSAMTTLQDNSPGSPTVEYNPVDHLQDSIGEGENDNRGGRGGGGGRRDSNKSTHNSTSSVI